MFVGQVKILSYSSCRTSAILKYFCPLQMPFIFSDITVLMNHLKCRDVAFVELLSGLLKYNPGTVTNV